MERGPTLSYHCCVCSGIFTKFVIFEGHLAFSGKCRKKIGFYTQCYACKVEFKSLAALKYHQSQQQDCIVVVKANPKKAVESGIVQLEISTQEPEEESKLICFYCGTCGKGFATKFHLRAHSATHYTGSAVDVIENESQASFIRPLPLDHDFDALGSEELSRISESVRVNGSYVGDVQTGKSSRYSKVPLLGKRTANQCCQKEINSKNKRKESKQVTSAKLSLRGKRNRVHQCRQCKAKFKFAAKLIQHMAVHVYGTVACNVCKVMFTPTALVKHRSAFHFNDIPKILDTEQINSLNSSLTVKAGANKCGLCKAKFKRDYKLKQHMTIHIFGTAACPFCKVMFTPTSLVGHENVCHYNQKNFKRNVSRRSHSRKTNLNLHKKKVLINRVNGDGTFLRCYECYVCKKILQNFGDLRNHIYKHSVYQQWIDPSNIILSNWNPKDTQEILQNQPLVLVENLNIDRIHSAALHRNLRSNPTYVLEPTIHITKQSESCIPTSTNYAECFVDNISLGWQNVKLELNLSEYQIKDECMEGVEGNSINTGGYTRIDDLQSIHSIKPETQSDDDVIVVEKKNTVGYAIDVIDLSSDGDDDDDDVIFISETFCCD